MINFVETEMSSNMEVELMILDTPVDLIMEHIKSQISRTYGSVNYLNIVTDKLSEIEENYPDDPDTLFKVNEMRNLIFSEVANILKEYFGIDINIDYSSPKETEEIVTDLYQFFVVNVAKTTYRFILNFIKENKKDIVDTLDLNKPKKDVVSVANRKKLKSVDAKIVSNLYEVVEYIMGLEIADDQFLEYTKNKPVLDLYERNILAGSIAEEFKKYVEDNRIAQDIIPELYVKLTSKE